MKIRNINKEHQDNLSIQDKLALKLTSSVGTMYCFYAFAILALISAPSAFSSGSSLIIISWITQTFLQLVLLPLLMVGQNLQSRHSELRAEHEYELAIENDKMDKQTLELLNEILKELKK